MKAKERDILSLLIINVRTHILLHTVTVSKYKAIKICIGINL